MKLEKRSKTFEVRAINSEEKKMRIEGYAVIFDSPTVIYKNAEGEEFYEKIDANAFNNCKMDNVVLTFNHSQDYLPLATTRNGSLKLTVDKKGLKVEAELIPTQANRDIYENIKNGIISKMSFAFTVRKDEYDRETRINTILEIEQLFDCCVTATPYYEDTELVARAMKDFIKNGGINMLQEEKTKLQEEVEKLKKLNLENKQSSKDDIDAIISEIEAEIEKLYTEDEKKEVKEVKDVVIEKEIKKDEDLDEKIDDKLDYIEDVVDEEEKEKLMRNKQDVLAEKRARAKELSENKSVKDTQVIEKRNIKLGGTSMKEERTLNDVLSSKEYRSAWAKSLMGQRLENVEKRALGDAITTTATDFVASTETVQGINNGGLFIPTEVRTNILEKINKTSPFLRDVKKIAVAGNVDIPYLNESDDSEWYAETVDTKNEGQEYKNLKLTGHELAKQVVVTWKLEKMAVDDFIDFITDEIAEKMGKALAKAVLYGDGNNQPTGALNGLVAVNGDNVIDAVLAAYKSLSEDARIGAKSYISSTYGIDMVSYKDGNGNYPFLNGLKGTAVISIEEDPFLNATDILVGNPKNYILNTVESITINREPSASKRKTTYAGYAIYDGMPRPNSFAKATVTSTNEAQ